MDPTDHPSLTHLLDILEEAAQGDRVTVQDILHEIGDRSIMPIVLAIALLMVSPLSGIPGLPTLSALLIVMVMVQALFGRRHLWLPGLVRNRAVPVRRLRRAVAALRRPARWIDRHSHPRLRMLTGGPLRLGTLLLCLLIPMTWPLLELLPFVTSFGAGAVSLMAFGLFTRDGLYVLLGYGVVGGLAALTLWLVQAGT
ncbi:exopolysaccharide biosynthesis protein [uncultured Tateyamaria sp.]|uniref:exopolysaccharide biosynthesis protein n=1 Tax=uncultured Tateyamaria sp. TaxID=455651 RepID=UPI00260B2A39|nr:exopolysaccharide biosynthesis protein [uncultured Tateyamaria sp.]